ncbi:MAG: hypothetical protein DKINENOH_02503 [bacterium]|nr:hypothetical protein [bacterium]
MNQTDCLPLRPPAAKRHGAATPARAVLLLAALFSWVAGCGVYSFSGSANPHLKTVAVPIFEDRTAEFGVKEQLTEAIIASFNRDNTLKIADRRVADAIVSGTILRLNEQAGVYTAQEQVQEIRVYLTVKIKCDDVKKRKVLWEEELTQFGAYVPGGANSGDRQSAINSAIDKIATEVLNRTVSGW